MNRSKPWSADDKSSSRVCLSPHEVPRQLEAVPAGARGLAGAQRRHAGLAQPRSARAPCAATSRSSSRCAARYGAKSVGRCGPAPAPHGAYSRVGVGHGAERVIGGAVVHADQPIARHAAARTVGSRHGPLHQRGVCAPMPPTMRQQFGDQAGARRESRMPKSTMDCVTAGRCA